MHKMQAAFFLPQAAFFLPLYAPARQNLPGTARTPPGLAPAKIFLKIVFLKTGGIRSIWEELRVCTA